MRKINARDCEIIDVDVKTERLFLEENHLQGYARAKICYGLVLNGELVQVMSFGKPRFNKNYQWELIRDCTKKDCLVRGGVSKLWEYFTEQVNPIDCICYSYPHDTNEFTTKYIDNCGFKNIKQAKQATKIRFVGTWNGSEITIEKSILERHGVDRLLKGSFGHDRTNEQILLDLNFKREEYDGVDPQIDTWFCGGCVYRMEIIGTDKFYIGQTRKDLETYWGSGSDWKSYLDKNNIPRDDQHIKKIVIEDSFNNYNEMCERELEEIHKYCFKSENKLWDVLPEYIGKLLNKNLSGVYPYNFASCKECGGKNGQHKKGCSLDRNVCEECGGRNGKHNKSCSRCKKTPPCQECGGIDGKHRKHCSKYKDKGTCCECGGLDGAHYKSCSKFVRNNPCPECGGTTVHKKTCSKYKKEKCEECGKTSGPHKPWCSKYKEPMVCEECGGTYSHKNGCSKKKDSKICPECGVVGGNHMKSCSRYKKPKTFCEECGKVGRARHKSWCSKYVEIKKCEECGGRDGHHKKNCSKYKHNK